MKEQPAQSPISQNTSALDSTRWMAAPLAFALLFGCGQDQTLLVGSEENSADGGGQAPQIVPEGTGGTSAAGGAPGPSTTVGTGGWGGSSSQSTLIPTTITVATTCAPITTATGILNPCGHAFGVAYSPDGQILAVGSDSAMPSVHLWRLSDGMPLPGLDLQTTDTTYNLAFSPDGKTLATAGYLPRANGNNVDDSNSAMVRLWDVTTGALVRALPVHTGFYADAVAFTRDGALLATAGYEGEAEIWRVADGTRLRGFAVSGTAHNLHFSPDDSMLIVACTDGAARIWNVSTGALILDKITVANEMADADFSPDGKQIASTGDGNFVRIWDAATGELLQTLGGHSRYISHVVWVDQNRLLSDDWGGGVILWSRDSSGTFAASNAWSTGGQALGLAVSPDKTRFVTGGAGQSQAGFVFLPL